MKLFYRVYGALIVVIVLTLAADGYLNFHREVNQFEYEMAMDAELWGSIIAKLVARNMETLGAEYTLNLIKVLNKEEPRVEVKWHEFAEINKHFATIENAQERLALLAAGKTINVKEPETRLATNLITYIPVTIGDRKYGIIQLTKPFYPILQYTRESRIWSLGVGILLLLMSGGVLWVVFNRLIRLPVEALTQKAVRIGQGDLSTSKVLPRDDELAELANMMNVMAANLARARDNTEQESQARLAALEQLRHSERLATVGRLAAGLAHELGTPLNVIAGRAKLIESEELDETEKLSSARVIREQVQRMSGLMRQLLDFARRRQGKKVQSDLTKLIQQVLEALQPIAIKSQVNIIYDATEVFPGVMMDSSHMQQVLFNLIINGIQAMPNGGDLKIALHLTRHWPGIPSYGQPKDSLDQEWLALHIVDSGEGIDDAIKANIFEPFFTTKKVGEGTGLGLSIVEGIIQEHGGHIDVESEPGKGTTFIVLLPVGRYSGHSNRQSVEGNS